MEGSGRSRMSQLTGANIGSPLAVLINDKLEAFMFMDEKIRGEGCITFPPLRTEAEMKMIKCVLGGRSLPSGLKITKIDTLPIE